MVETDKVYICKHESCENQVNTNKGAGAFCPVPQEGRLTHRQQFLATRPTAPRHARPRKPETIRAIPELHLPNTEADSINHPAHYGGDTTYEVIKVIEAWELDFGLGNCVKYIARAGKKNDILEDLQKALFYLNRRVEQLANAK